MASTDTIFILDPLAAVPPATLYATLDFIADLSTPVANTPVLDFDPGTDEYAYWFMTVPAHYAGGGFTISWKGGTDNTNTGTLEIEVRILTIADTTDLSSDLGIDTQTEVPLLDTPSGGVADQLNYSATGTLTHANAGSPSTGDRMVIAARRDTATDTNTGDLQLAEILILET